MWNIKTCNKTRALFSRSPENPVVYDDHDDDRAPEGHEGGEERVGEVRVEDTEAGLVVNL